MTTKTLYDEKELLIHASNGSEEAFSLIFHTYKNKLYGYLFRITESSDVAEDIIQEIFLKLWKDKADLVKLGADFAYTIDGETLGSIEDETFSADGAKLVINGVSAHPGFAKGKKPT